MQIEENTAVIALTWGGSILLAVSSESGGGQPGG